MFIYSEIVNYQIGGDYLGLKFAGESDSCICEDGSR